MKTVYSPSTHKLIKLAQKVLREYPKAPIGELAEKALEEAYNENRTEHETLRIVRPTES